jgi:hypothetical protein
MAGIGSLPDGEVERAGVLSQVVESIGTTPPEIPMEEPEANKPAAKAPHTAWKRHLDAIADEMVRLTAVCDVDLRAPGAIDRVLSGDEAVCGKRNPIGFKKLRSLLAATYESLNKAVDRIGKDDAKALTDEIIARVDARRAAGGQKKGASGNPFG